MTDEYKDKKPLRRPRTQSAYDPVKAALRQLYDKVIAEEIPDDFLDLVNRLDTQSEKDEIE